MITFRDNYRHTTMTVAHDDDGSVTVILSRDFGSDKLTDLRMGVELSSEDLIPLAQIGQTALRKEIQDFLDTAEENLASASLCPTCRANVDQGCCNPRSGDLLQRPHANRAGARISALRAQRQNMMELLRQVMNENG